MKLKSIKEGNFELKNHIGQLMTIAIVVFLLVYQWVGVEWSLKSLSDASFWSNLVVNMFLTVGTYTIYLHQYKELAEQEEKYIKTLNILGKLIRQILHFGVASTLREYAEEKKKEEIISIKETRKKSTFLTEEEYKSAIKLSKKDCIKKYNKNIYKLLVQSQKEVNIDAVDVTHILSGRSGNSKNRLVFNEKWQEKKFIILKSFKFLIWAVLASSIFFSSKDNDLIVVMTWLLMRLCAMGLAINGGVKDGRLFTLELKRSYHKSCIVYLTEFFTWHKQKNNNKINWQMPDIGDIKNEKENKSNDINSNNIANSAPLNT